MRARGAPETFAARPAPPGESGARGRMAVARERDPPVESWFEAVRVAAVERMAVARQRDPPGEGGGYTSKPVSWLMFSVGRSSSS